MDPMEKVAKAFTDSLSVALAPLLAAVRDLTPPSTTNAAVRQYTANTTQNGPAVPANPNRKALQIANTHATVAIEYGYSRNLAYGFGIPILAGKNEYLNLNPHLGEVFIVCASGTVDVRIADVSYGEREQTSGS